MSAKPACTVYIGNLDERVSDRVLYDILIQAGRVIDLYIPRDRETDRPKGFAFVEYETEEIANYAVRLFSGLVNLYNRTLKFAISGQDKPSLSLPPATPSSNPSSKPGPHRVTNNTSATSQNSTGLSLSCICSSQSGSYAQASVSPGLVNQHHKGYTSSFQGNDFDCS
ncbi:RNA recognition motif domain [Dillenia turbinata]|uniref:RNA recognition motif domain n=1 Tax=Dillenia turbinata TaxID=194707 RepID=A0AAN8VPR5_9MAGN